MMVQTTELAVSSLNHWDAYTHFTQANGYTSVHIINKLQFLVRSMDVQESTERSYLIMISIVIP